MWNIDKEFAFDYSHRVYTQELKEGYAENMKCACRFWHGHRGVIKLFLEAESLNDQGMVFDFKNLGFFKIWLDNTLDHKCIVGREDPLLPVCFSNYQQYVTKVDEMSGAMLFDQASSLEGPLRELYESLVIVDFTPTSENLSKWIFGIVKKKMEKLPGVTVSKVEFNETPKSRATYTSD